MFLALFCPDYIRCGGNGGTLGGCQPRRTLGKGGGGEGRWWAGGGRARGKGVDERKRGEGGRNGATGELRISRDQRVGRVAV